MPPLLKYKLLSYVRIRPNVADLKRYLSFDIAALKECFIDVSAWCALKCLQLTELLLFETAANLKKIPLGSKLHVTV